MFYLLTPQSTVILEKLTMTDLVTNILPFITYKVPLLSSHKCKVQ